MGMKEHVFESYPAVKKDSINNVRMRVLHVLNHVNDHGNGIVNVAVDLAIEQALDGNTVAIASKGGNFIPLLSQYQVRHFQLDQTRTLPNLLKSAATFRAIIRDFQPDIVHVHMMTGALLAKTLRFRSRYRIVSTVHNEFQKSAILMGLADNVIAVSTAVKTSMQQRGIRENRLSVVTNGSIGTKRGQIDAVECTDPVLAQPAIVTVAGMYTRKGIATLLQAFELTCQRIPHSHLYLVGEGPDRALFEAQAKEMSCATQIHFEGFRNNPEGYMRHARLFVLASYKDPCPLVLIEARKSGCAIVASAVDGIPEMLDEGEAGILVPPQDVPALSQAIISVLSDDDVHQRLSTNAASNLGRFSVQRLHAETMDVYANL